MAEPMSTGSPPPIDTLELRQRLWRIAGKQFRGRKQELAQLRAFAAAAPRRSMLGALFGRGAHFAVAITGPGGIGKSALAARFILEHTKVPGLVFAHLSFADPDIGTAEPLTLLAEVMRQLGIEHPRLRESCERSRAAWLQQAGREADLGKLRLAAISDVAGVLKSVTHGRHPIVWVLDSFEQLLAQAEPAADQVWQMLEALHVRIPSLRFILTSRTEIARPTVKMLRLSTFDEQSALAYLRPCSIPDQTARELFRDFGGSPLALQLAATLAMHRSWEPSADAELCASYQRMLAHIRDDGLRKLAQLAVVLRRLTPELLLHVLAEPCGVAIDSMERAQALFAELATDIHLFEVETSAGQCRRADELRYRHALRQPLLARLRQEAQDQVRCIDEAAVRFYAGQRSERERAEEIYHRLWLGQSAADISARWREGVACHLVSAVVELDAPQRELLVELCCTPSDAVPRIASATDREAVNVLALQLQHASPAERIALTLQRAHLVIKFELAELARAAAEDLQCIEVPSLDATHQLHSVALRTFLARMHEDARALAPEPFLLLSLMDPSVLAAAPVAAHWAAAAPGADAKARVVRLVETVGITPGAAAPMSSLAVTLATLDAQFSHSRGTEPGLLAICSSVPGLESVTRTWSDFVQSASQQQLQKAIALALRLLSNSDALVTALQRLLCELLDIRVPAVPAVVPSAASRSDDAEIREIAEVILTSFSVEDLRPLLLAKLQRRLEDPPPAATPSAILAALVATARSEGWLAQLLAVLLATHSEDQRIADLASRFGACNIISR